MVMVPSKQLPVMEMAGLGKTGRLYSFEGIWDPTQDVEAALIRSLVDRFSLTVKPLRAILGEAEFDRLRSIRERSFLNQIRFRSAEDVLQHPDPEDLPGVQALGLDVALEVWITLRIVRSSMAGQSLLLHSHARLRGSDGAVLWTSTGMGTAAIPGLKDFVELAKGDLALLKRALATAAANLVATENRMELFHGVARH